MLYLNSLLLSSQFFDVTNVATIVAIVLLLIFSAFFCI